MTELAVIGASCEAYGHPTECEEPASGTVTSDGSTNITVTANGETREVASVATASISFSEHAHDHDNTNGCHAYESHTLDPNGVDSITINGSPVYQVTDTVASDPVTGGDIDISSNPMETNIQ